MVGWGYNDYGQAPAVYSPPAGLDAKAIAGGELSSFALLEDGSVAAWGQSTFGDITPPAGLDDVAQVSAGWYHALALLDDGTVVAWGYNKWGQCDIPEGLVVE